MNLKPVMNDNLIMRKQPSSLGALRASRGSSVHIWELKFEIGDERNGPADREGETFWPVIKALWETKLTPLSGGRPAT